MPEKSAITNYPWSSYYLDGCTTSMSFGDSKWVAIDFEANPTTGFKWHAQLENIESTCLSLFDSDYKKDASPPNYVGVGGVRTMLFEVTGTDCSETVYLNYARPWLFKNGFDLSSTNMAKNPYMKLDITAGKVVPPKPVC